MALLLCIDTATEKASVGLCEDDKVIASLDNGDPKNHSAFLQTGIQKIMQAANVSFQQLNAVAVVNGPGSYTGLRVGLASAKGICYATGKPLILLNTLQVMASAAIEKYNDENLLYCPMIDARRNEVFAALYNFFLQPLLLPQPIIIAKNAFADQLSQKKIVFLGSGHNKCELIITHENAVFAHVLYGMKHISKIARDLYVLEEFADVAYAEPYYTKEFYLPRKL